MNRLFSNPDSLRSVETDLCFLSEERPDVKDKTFPHDPYTCFVGGEHVYFFTSTGMNEARNATKCKHCGKQMKPLVGLWAPLDDENKDKRTVTIFVCTSKSCSCNLSERFVVLRSECSPRDDCCSSKSKGEKKEGNILISSGGGLFDMGDWGDCDDDEQSNSSPIEDECSRDETGDCSIDDDCCYYCLDCSDGDCIEKYYLEIGKESSDIPLTESEIAAQAKAADLLARYKAERESHPECFEGDDEFGDFSETDESERDDEAFECFQERLKRAPEQIIRWSHKGIALQTSDSRPICDIQVPCCELCGSARVFELQVLPTLFSFINIDKDSVWEFGTLNVFVCSKNCSSDGAKEYIVVEPPL